MTSGSHARPHSGPPPLESPPPLIDRTSSPTENTPLLDSTLPKPIDDDESQDVSDTDSDAGSIVVVVQEMSELRLILTLTTTWVGVFLGAVDAATQSIIATLSGPISSDFKSMSLMSWLATAYLIANASCQPLSGRLTDIFGRGPGLVFSNLMFALGNLICGLANDRYTIVFGRVIAGIGGGGLMSISTFLGSDLVPLRKRGIYQGIGNISYGAGSMLGGVFGGVLSDADLLGLGWRLAFLIQVPIVVASAVLVHILVRVPPKVSNKSLISRIDFGGSLLTISFLVVLLLGLNTGGTVVPWTHPLVLSTFPVSLVLLATFIWWESRAKQPIIPVRLLLDRTIFSACITNLVSTMVMMTASFYIPLYLQVLGYSATQSGLRLLAAPLGVSISSVSAGIIMKSTGRYVGLGVSIQVIFLVGVIALNFLDQDTPNWVPFVAMGLHGAGYGAMLTITLLACIAAVEHSQQAVVTAATYLFRSVGATVGLTIASTIYQNVLQARLQGRFGSLPGALEEIERIRNDLSELRNLPEGWHDGVISSFMEAFHGVWLASLGLAVVGLISISLMKQHKLHSNLARAED
ncbi:hypothetical protein OQA88_6520 [Cercophora sp. LCS_1]